MLKQTFHTDAQLFSLDFFKQLFGHIEVTAGIDGTNVVASVDEMKANGLLWVMADFKLVFKNEADFSSTYTLVTFPLEANPLYAIRAHNIYNAEGKIVAQSFTRWVTMQIDTRGLGRIPQYIIHRKYEQETAALAYEKLRLNKVVDVQKSKSYAIQSHDVDQNEHTNNTVYMIKCIEAALEFGLDLGLIKTFSIQFKQETRLHDKLQIHSGGSLQSCSLKIVPISSSAEVSLAEIQCV
jgi:acyl-ACP thioesterase